MVMDSVDVDGLVVVVDSVDVDGLHTVEIKIR